MESYNNIYRDIATRTQGDIYIGVVGPVRTGKSTFIKKFMDMIVLPHMDNDYKRARALDELPQSAGGRTIMTTEPKFIPNEAVEISAGDAARFKVRMIDCVGYIVDGARGYIEDEMPRMVMSPWADEPIPFADAAEIGTRKVISEHSTVGIVVTTDGSITEIDREDYIDAEERVIRELKELNKPFIVIMNCVAPNSPRVKEQCENISEKFGVTVVPLNCMTMNDTDINYVMEQILYEFPLKEVGVNIPSWILSLKEENPLREGIQNAVFDKSDKIRKISDVVNLPEMLKECEFVEDVKLDKMDAGKGIAEIKIIVPDRLFYEAVKEMTGFIIDDRLTMLSQLMELSQIKKEYDKIASALLEVKQKGYGIVTPSLEELTLEEPEIVKQGSRFGVRLKASAPSIHMIRADIETEVSPIVGTERQSEELVHYLLNEFESDTKKIWESNIFGKSLHELVNEGLHNKLYRMPDDAQMKLQETLQKIINEGSGGMICIIL
ncbi:MAG: stage IV sporulation protein A [Clostridia bacterium]|nr:stage IV sporulation protein A [Clostridia bacterium]